MADDPKTHLKEMADRGQLPPASYSTTRYGGTEHQPGWTADVSLPDGRTAQGVGRSKSEAEQDAAAALIQNYGLRRDSR